jgi:transmembrane sensor
VDDELLLRVIAGRATAAERELVDAWRAAAPPNDARFAELATDMQALRRWYRSTGAPPAMPSAQHIVRQATLRGAPANRRPQPWRTLAPWAAAAIIVALGLAAVQIRRQKDVPRELAAVDVGDSDSGITPVLLNDGTRIRLGAGSRFHVEQAGAARQVWLEGRAEFNVAHDSSRPFRVRTKAGELLDLGTRFVVRADGATMQVAVFEGRVAVSANGASVELTAGQLTNVADGELLRLSASGTAHTATDWLRAALVFEGRTLDQVAAELSRHYRIRVRVADSAIARQTVSAWFIDEPPARSALAVICRAVDVRCRISDSGAEMSSRSP